MPDTFGSILRRIKNPTNSLWPANIRTRVPKKTNYQELSLKRNLMTGLPEAWVDRNREFYYPVSPLFTIFQPPRGQVSPTVRFVPEEAMGYRNLVQPKRQYISLPQDNYYRQMYQGGLAPYNPQGAPLLRHEPHHFGMAIPAPYSYWLRFNSYTMFQMSNPRAMEKSYLPVYTPSPQYSPNLPAYRGPR
jgi:hypothetical protein